MTPRDASGSIGGMHVVITDKGVSVELSCGDAVALLEQLGDVSAKGRPKVRQLHQQIENALTWRGQGAVGRRQA